MNADALRSALLDYQLHAHRLERSLGRGGAPVDLDVARGELPHAAAALQRIGDLLNEPGDAR